MQAETCWINPHNLAPSELRFGGYKQSGVWRENSLAAKADYSQLKSVHIETRNVSALLSFVLA